MMWRWLTTVAFALLLHGCAGHESRVKAALDALDRNQPDQAIVALRSNLVPLDRQVDSL